MTVAFILVGITICVIAVAYVVIKDLAEARSDYND
jgi:hypothetical protein